MAPRRRASFLPVELRELDELQRLVILAIAIAGCLLRFFFWFHTERIWEDALITVLHSENFALGLGLTHQHPGYPPLHGFTSPISVLVPLLADVFRAGWGLPFQKTVSALIAVPTVLLAASVALNQAFRLNIWLVYLLCGYLAFEHHQILWGMAGMETQIAVFALFFAMHSALKGKPLRLGASMAFCIYVRPDFAIFVLFIALHLALSNRSVLLPAIGISLALYAPWIAFTTLYYGSPIPNTIVAKSLGYPLWIRNVALFSTPFWTNVWARVYDSIFLPLGPSFAGHGGGFLKFPDNGHISHLCALILLLGCIPMLTSFRKFYVIPMGACAAYSAYYVFLVPAVAGWYLVPFSAINCLLLVLGMGALMDALVSPDRIPVLSRLACLIYIASFLAALPTTFEAERNIQRYIETPVRMAIGTYLRDHKKPGEAVGCEPLGYIGYYSRMPVYDFPGLASPEVSAFMRQNPNKRALELMLAHLKPAWIVLRDGEYNYLQTMPHLQFLKSEYSIEKRFRAQPDRVAEVYRADANIDRSFVLLKQRQVH